MKIPRTNEIKNHRNGIHSRFNFTLYFNQCRLSLQSPPAVNFRNFASSLQNSRIPHIFSVHPTSAYQCLLIHWDFSLKGSVPNLPFPKHKTHYTSNLNLNTDFHGFTGLKRFWNLTILIFVNPRAFLRISFKTSRTLRTLREIIPRRTANLTKCMIKKLTQSPRSSQSFK